MESLISSPSQYCCTTGFRSESRKTPSLYVGPPTPEVTILVGGIFFCLMSSMDNLCSLNNGYIYGFFTTNSCPRDQPPFFVCPEIANTSSGSSRFFSPKLFTRFFISFLISALGSFSSFLKFFSSFRVFSMIFATSSASRIKIQPPLSTLVM